MWTKSFVLDTFHQFLSILISLFINRYYWGCSKDNLHATAKWAGLAVGIYIIGTVVARRLAGFISILGVARCLYLGLLII